MFKEIPDISWKKNQYGSPFALFFGHQWKFWIQKGDKSQVMDPRQEGAKNIVYLV